MEVLKTLKIFYWVVDNIGIKFFQVLCLSVVISLCSQPAVAEVYQWKDANGKIHFGDKRHAPDSVDEVQLKDTNSSEAVVVKERNQDDGQSSHIDNSLPDPAVGKSISSSCFEKSQRYKNQGESYFDIKNVSLTEEDIDALEAFHRSSEGEWEGRSLEIVCNGTDENPRREVKRSVAKVEIHKAANHAVKLGVEREYDEGYGDRAESLFLFMKHALTSFERGVNSLEAVEKYRRTTRNGNWFNESYIEVNYSKGKLYINIVYYTAGVYVSQETIQLTRK